MYCHDGENGGGGMGVGLLVTIDEYIGRCSAEAGAEILIHVLICMRVDRLKYTFHGLVIHPAPLLVPIPTPCLSDPDSLLESFRRWQTNQHKTILPASMKAGW